MESLSLKWGTVKCWNNLSDVSCAALQKWADFGVCMSAALQKSSDEQKQALCHVIDCVSDGGGTIYNDWSGKDMTADEAKAYVMENGR